MQIRDSVVHLTGDDVMTAIDAYLTAHNIDVSGLRRVRIVITDPLNGKSKTHACEELDAEVCVDPFGKIMDNRSL